MPLSDFAIYNKIELSENNCYKEIFNALEDI